MKKFFKRLISRLRGELPTEEYIKRGMTIGKNFNRLERVSMDISHCWLISIGDNVTLAPGVRLIAHDASTSNKIIKGLDTKIGLVTIGNNVFVGAGSIVIRNVTIGDNVIIGAGSVVTRDIPSNSVAAGNPAKVIGSFEDYVKKNRELYETKPYFGGKKAVNANSLIEKKREQVRMLREHKIGFVGHGEKRTNN